METTGCTCKTGYSGTITAKDNGYYFNGGYDGACYESGQKCGKDVGFSADAEKSKTYSGGWQEVREYRTEGTPTIYSVGLSFERNSGRFLAPTSGYYLCSTQLRIENFGSSYTRVTIAIDGTKDNQNGMTTMLGDYASTNYRAQGLSGVIYVKAKQFVSVWVQSVTDNSWQVQSESGFSCHQLRTLVGFHADKNGDQSMAKEWKEVGLFAHE